MHKKPICLSPLSALQSGTEAVSKGGSLWFPFFRHFFVERQRNGIHTAQRGAQLDEVEVGCTRVKRNGCTNFR